MRGTGTDCLLCAGVRLELRRAVNNYWRLDGPAWWSLPSWVDGRCQWKPVVFLFCCVAPPLETVEIPRPERHSLPHLRFGPLSRSCRRAGRRVCVSLAASAFFPFSAPGRFTVTSTTNIRPHHPPALPVVTRYKKLFITSKR